MSSAENEADRGPLLGSLLRLASQAMIERFAANTLEENLTLRALQDMTMSQRRHATIILLGESFQTFTPMQAFQQSVHAVINSSELFLVKQLIEKAVADNAMFLQSYLEVQARILSAGNRR